MSQGSSVSPCSINNERIPLSPSMKKPNSGKKTCSCANDTKSDNDSNTNCDMDFKTFHRNRDDINRTCKDINDSKSHSKNNKDTRFIPYSRLSENKNITNNNLSRDIHNDINDNKNIASIDGEPILPECKYGISKGAKCSNRQDLPNHPCCSCSCSNLTAPHNKCSACNYITSWMNRNFLSNIEFYCNAHGSQTVNDNIFMKYKSRTEMGQKKLTEGILYESSSSKSQLLEVIPTVHRRKRGPIDAISTLAKVCTGLLSGVPELQFSAMITINKIIDASVIYRIGDIPIEEYRLKDAKR